MTSRLEPPQRPYWNWILKSAAERSPVNFRYIFIILTVLEIWNLSIKMRHYIHAFISSSRNYMGDGLAFAISYLYHKYI